MSSVSFLQAGFSEDLAIDYVCDLTGKIIQKNLHDSTSKKIFLSDATMPNKQLS
jgi:hypothetical protein